MFFFLQFSKGPLKLANLTRSIDFYQKNSIVHFVVKECAQRLLASAVFNVNDLRIFLNREDMIENLKRAENVDGIPR